MLKLNNDSNITDTQVVLSQAFMGGKALFSTVDELMKTYGQRMFK